MRSHLVVPLGVSLGIAMALSGCGHRRHARISPPPPPPPSTAGGTQPRSQRRPQAGSPSRPASRPQPSARRAEPPREARVGQTEEGIASWYGYPYHGRQAADGEIYDMEKLVAAHRTLPFHTWVRVQNLDNDTAVDVEIIDRGPFIDGRIIDLSHAAAQAVNMIGPGTAKVRIRVIEPPAVADQRPTPAPAAPAPSAAAVPAPAGFPSHYAVQVGAFRDRGAAERLREDMASRYRVATLVMRDGNPAMWRVLVGDESSEDAAGSLAERIRGEGNAPGGALVVRLDI